MWNGNTSPPSPLLERRGDGGEVLLITSYLLIISSINF